MARDWSHILTTGDKVLCVLLTGVIAALFAFQFSRTDEGDLILVFVDDKVAYKAALSYDSEFTVQGRTGKLEIIIKDRQMSVHAAECPNKLCIRSGGMSAAGDVIVCAPNRVVIRIEQKPAFRGVTG